MSNQPTEITEKEIKAFLWGYLAGNPQREAFLRNIPPLSEKEVNRLSFFLRNSERLVQQLFQQRITSPYDEGEAITKLIEKAYTNQGIATFLTEAQKKFSFLETQYGYQRLGEVHEDQDPRDKDVVSFYVSSQIGVKLMWSYTSGSVLVLFVELLKPGKFPPRYSVVENKNHSDVARAISLEILAEVLGYGDDPHFVLKRNKNNPEHWRIPFEQMTDVLDGLAFCVQKYADNVLKGDTNLFEKVIQYYSQKMKI